MYWNTIQANELWFGGKRNNIKAHTMRPEYPQLLSIIIWTLFNICDRRMNQTRNGQNKKHTHKKKTNTNQPALHLNK